MNITCHVAHGPLFRSAHSKDPPLCLFKKKRRVYNLCLLGERYESFSGCAYVIRESVKSFFEFSGGDLQRCRPLMYSIAKIMKIFPRNRKARKISFTSPERVDVDIRSRIMLLGSVTCFVSFFRGEREQ